MHVDGQFIANQPPWLALWEKKTDEKIVSCSHIIHPVWWVVAASLFTLVGQNLQNGNTDFSYQLSQALSLSLSQVLLVEWSTIMNECIYVTDISLLSSTLLACTFCLTWCHYFFLKLVSQTRLHLDSLLLMQQVICKLARFQLVAFVDC